MRTKTAGSAPSPVLPGPLNPIMLSIAVVLLLSAQYGVTGAARAQEHQSEKPTTTATRPVDPAYQKERGPFETVLIRELLLEDSHRGTKVPVRIRAPRLRDGVPEPYPLVIFSHGAGGSGEAFAALCEHWASYGYVVVNPTHSDSVKLRREKGERFDLGNRAIARQVVSGVNLLDRRADIALILDSLEKIEDAIKAALPPSSTSSHAAVCIDRNRIALAGHSAGAMTTEALAGVKFYAGRAGRLPWSWPERRIKAFILISGQGLGRPTFHKDSWSDIRSSMLVIAGSEDRSPVSDEEPAGRRDPYTYAPAGNKYLVFIEGATHGSYAGKQVTRWLGEKPSGNVKYITDVTAFATLAFLDAHLKDSADARAYLRSDALAHYPGGKLDYEHK